ncbi:MAG TPA: hypothetical protein PLH79_11800 [bacterium]|nr:hypothetical protein [bacterium]
MNPQSVESSRRGLFYWGIACFLILQSGGVGPVWAVDIFGEELGVTIESSYVSKYLWKGYDVLDDHGAWQPSLTLDYRGFYVGVWGSWPTSSGFVDATELDYYLGSAQSFFEEEWYALDADIAWYYYDYPHSDSHAGDDGISDSQEIVLALSMPNLIPLGPSHLVPSYTVGYNWDGIQSGEDVDNGWIHTFGLAYDIPIPALIPGQEEAAISLGWDISYNDGMFESDSGWSHSTARVSTVFEWHGFSLTPALFYQWSFEDTVNLEDEFFASVSLNYAF